MKRLLFFIITVSVFSVLIQSCCTKKDCSYAVTPQLVAVYHGFADSEIEQKVVLIQDRNTMQLVDSVRGQRYDLLNNYAVNGDIRQYRFFVKFAFGRTDTISSVSYNIYTESVGCNQCFPFGEDKAQVTKYKDFSWVYNGVTSGSDTLVINR